ncbi:hypothetical protein EJ110_NYTH57823 [Nymphaea thermarum]|nr:hypothetical protein EJ110_NYTH57823 [Nymphaea thermarum]
MSLQGFYILEVAISVTISSAGTSSSFPQPLASGVVREELKAGGCKCLASLPSLLGSKTSLRMLDLNLTAIKELPSSVVSLKKLEVLSVLCWKRLKFLQASASVGSLMLLKSHGMSSISGDERPSERRCYSLPLFLPSLTKLNANDCHQL